MFVCKSMCSLLCKHIMMWLATCLKASVKHNWYWLMIIIYTNIHTPMYNSRAQLPQHTHTHTHTHTRNTHTHTQARAWASRTRTHVCVWPIHLHVCHAVQTGSPRCSHSLLLQSLLQRQTWRIRHHSYRWLSSLWRGKWLIHPNFQVRVHTHRFPA